MSQGRQAGLALAANTDTTLYSPGGALTGTFSVSFCNRTNGAINIRLGLCAGALGTLDWTTDALEFDTPIPANGVLERAGIPVSGAQTLVARASAAGITVVVYGLEG